MKKFPAVAILEFSEISTGIYSTDAMIKKAPIAFLKCGTITQGRYMTIIGGTTASVDEAWNEGRFWANDSLVDHVFLPDVHPEVLDTLFSKRSFHDANPIAVLETSTVATTIRAAESALKGTPVSLVELRLGDYGLAGKGVGIYQGELHDIEAAMDISTAWIEQTGATFHYKILSRPHDSLIQQLRGNSLFSETSGIELDGEKIEC